MFCCRLFSFLGGSVGNYLFTLICAKMVCSYNFAINFDYNMELWVIFVVWCWKLKIYDYDHSWKCLIWQFPNLSLSHIMQAAFSSTSLFEPFAIPLLLEKLSSSLQSAKVGININFIKLWLILIRQYLFFALSMCLRHVESELLSLYACRLIPWNTLAIAQWNMEQTGLKNMPKQCGLL